MSTKDQLTQHTGQTSRLEQAMTALAEAQVKTEDDAKELRSALTQLPQALAAFTTKTEHALSALAEAQAQTAGQFQAYLNTRRN